MKIDNDAAGAHFPTFKAKNTGNGNLRQREGKIKERQKRQNGDKEEAIICVKIERVPCKRTSC